MEVQPAQYLQIDLFPATVVIDGVSAGDDNKVILTDNRLYIIKEGQAGPYIYFEAPATRDGFDRPTIRTYTVETTDGHFVEFQRATNCGCGNRLRGVYPYTGIPFASMKPVSK